MWNIYQKTCIRLLNFPVDYIGKISCNIMQYLCNVLGDRNNPQKVGWYQSFLTSIWCEISPVTNINIFLCDRLCLTWFNFRRLFAKTHPSSSDLELWIFDRNHPVWWYTTGLFHRLFKDKELEWVAIISVKQSSIWLNIWAKGGKKWPKICRSMLYTYCH